MESKDKIKYARRIGSWYFLILGCWNLGMALFHSRTNWFDVVVLGLLILPVLIRAKRFYMVYGIAGLFFGVMGLVVLLATLESGSDFIWTGCLLVLSFMVASLLLACAGMVDEDDCFRLV